MAIPCTARSSPQARPNWRSGCKKLRSANVLVRRGSKNSSTRRVNGRQCEQEGAKTVASREGWLLTEEHDFPADCRAGAAGGGTQTEHVLGASCRCDGGAVYRRRVFNHRNGREVPAWSQQFWQRLVCRAYVVEHGRCLVRRLVLYVRLSERGETG